MGGVELGKALAHDIETVESQFRDASTQALVSRCRHWSGLVFLS